MILFENNVTQIYCRRLTRPQTVFQLSILEGPIHQIDQFQQASVLNS